MRPKAQPVPHLDSGILWWLYIPRRNHAKMLLKCFCACFRVFWSKLITRKSKCPDIWVGPGGQLKPLALETLNLSLETLNHPNFCSFLCRTIIQPGLMETPHQFSTLIQANIAQNIGLSHGSYQCNLSIGTKLCPKDWCILIKWRTHSKKLQTFTRWFKRKPIAWVLLLVHYFFSGINFTSTGSKCHAKLEYWINIQFTAQNNLTSLQTSLNWCQK